MAEELNRNPKHISVEVAGCPVISRVVHVRGFADGVKAPGSALWVEQARIQVVWLVRVLHGPWQSPFEQELSRRPVNHIVGE